VEVPELVDAGPRHVLVGVVHDGRALEVAGLEDLLVEVQRPPRERAVGELEVAVQRPV
jgi:hypothetical protein